MESSQFGVILTFGNGEILLLSSTDLSEIRKINAGGEVVQTSLYAEEEKDTLIVITKGDTCAVKSYQVKASGFKLKTESAVNADLKKAKLVKVDQATRNPLIISEDKKLIICKDQQATEINLENYIDTPGKKVFYSLISVYSRD